MNETEPKTMTSEDLLPAILRNDISTRSLDKLSNDELMELRAKLWVLSESIRDRIGEAK
jgi:hypothetical protein